MIRFVARYLCSAVVFAMVLPARASNPLVVKTDRGKVQGKMSADGQARDFLGIPYAAPPVGPLRWKPPQPAATWAGVRQATSFGFRCMQQEPFRDMVFRDPGESEDCLTLNLWVPAAKVKGKLPVMVWIYGGGFVGGTTSEPRQDGEHLTRKGVLVVSMNYRLGIFGFLATHELVVEDPHHSAGNYGLMDELACLQWVRRNIAAFGGDPDNVTIFGESAGSFAVSAQMASPLAKGLFAHAIGESGGAFASKELSFPLLEESVKLDEDYIRSVGGDTSLAALRALGSDQILKLARSKPAHERHFQPNTDGYFLPEKVPAIFAAGQQAHVPLIAGWNQDESIGDVLKAPEKWNGRGPAGNGREGIWAARSRISSRRTTPPMTPRRAAPRRTLPVTSSWFIPPGHGWKRRLGLAARRSTGIYSRSPRREILSIPSQPGPSTPMRLSMSSATWIRARERRLGRRTTSFPT